MKYRVLLTGNGNNDLWQKITGFNNAGFEIVKGTAAAASDAVARNNSPEIIIINCEFNSDDDYNICRQIRERFDGPILVIPKNYTPEMELRLIECGADDILNGLLTEESILAHLNMLVRRFRIDADRIGHNHRNNLIKIGRIEIDRTIRNVSVDGLEIQLTTAEFDLLWFLASRANRTVSRDDLYRALTGIEYNGLDRCVDLRICRLRKKLGDSVKKPRFIKSIRSEGYLLAGNIEQ
ncbi:MAG: winged helix-turn-helix domain-containing protein [Candidatus Zixiibacteriota bacterium]